MKIKYIENTPHIIPECQNEEDQLFDWYEKVKGKRVDAVISFEWLPRAVAKSSDEPGNCIIHAVNISVCECCNGKGYIDKTDGYDYGTVQCPVC